MAEPYHHGNLRQDLIDAGLAALCRDGIAAFSLRRLSQDLGVSHAAAYRHFSDKEDLLRAILVESSRRFRNALAASVDPAVGGEEALMRLGAAYVRFFIANPEILSLFTLLHSGQELFSELFRGMKERDPYGAEIGPHEDCGRIDEMPGDSAFGIFRTLAGMARGEERFRDLNEREILLGYWAKVHGLATLLVTQRGFIPEEEIEGTIDRLVRTPF
jgi:AcrR family transcriptional regulator